MKRMQQRMKNLIRMKELVHILSYYPQIFFAACREARHRAIRFKSGHALLPTHFGLSASIPGRALVSVLIMVVMISTTYGQKIDFNFRQKLSASDSASWYSIELPNPIFKNLNRQFTDLRIYQFNEKDTTEAPYLLTIHEQQLTEGTFELPAINQSKKDDVQYLTFELKKDQKVNYLKLEFKEENFDGYASIEGSADQKEWFEIERGQRIISIQNNNTQFTSSDLHFNLINFKYLRIQLSVDKTLTLTNATFKEQTIVPGIYSNIPLAWKETIDKSVKQSIITIDLKESQPVTKLLVEVEEKQDYYRPFRFEVLTDSTKAPKGWQYFYETLTSGYLTSLESNDFNFQLSVGRKFRLVIDHADNRPIKIKNITASKPKIDLIARLQTGNNNYLYYGSNYAGQPNYDLVVFKDKIPTEAPLLSLSTEEKLTKEKEPVSALIENKLWLWLAMGLIIGLLGFFTIRMMGKK